MALKKEIILENGITVNYHRIVSLNKVTNHANIIEIASYINKAEREKEKTYYQNEDNNKSMNVFINTKYITKEYVENETIEESYTYLKTLDIFENAEDEIESVIE